MRSWVVHDSGRVIAFDKPSGVPVQTRGGREESVDHLLWAFARSNGKRPRLVHRIDAATSGLLVAARTQPLAAFLSEAFASRTVEKRYLALVRGDLPEANEALIDVALRREVQPSGLEKVRVCAPDARDAKAARTRVRVLARADRVALVEARPETGRMHQIRVHLAHWGAPIMGDALYGAGVLSAPRLMLHAAGLSLPMPGGGRLALESPMAADMAEWGRGLGVVTAAA